MNVVSLLTLGTGRLYPAEDISGMSTVRG